MKKEDYLMTSLKTITQHRCLNKNIMIWYYGSNTCSLSKWVRKSKLTMKQDLMMKHQKNLKEKDKDRHMKLKLQQLHQIRFILKEIWHQKFKKLKPRERQCNSLIKLVIQKKLQIFKKNLYLKRKSLVNKDNDVINEIMKQINKQKYNQLIKNCNLYNYKTIFACIYRVQHSINYNQQKVNKQQIDQIQLNNLTFLFI
ncbi:hypothetical protein TTHERM_001026349 (macronuclear) [Tetrahymena thermophila SB210]|uniref:Uncharacterized protein n=1 Tax=Tetrahymena thermophila (strain SB210) TaxID=312017 RepID=W7XED6_TETTS|nr:hypothetical protein TTHERM_001026349 [Tetrahymena thermophila SB210]EWS76042.1 hypothetical protein TTHERM_001026349 [Tetrahymena thermophila SB210]|eukprot:XP_012651426.1 hypothetical protein TTHERM_001026349 [Tetrahymena thermophila SB210]